jgi:transposase
MEYFAGLDISMDETHICILDREGVVVRESRTASTAEAMAVELAKAASCRRIVFETGRMAPIVFHRLSQFGFPVICVESRRPIRRSSRLRLTRPTAMMREGWRTWLALTSSSPCM